MFLLFFVGMIKDITNENLYGIIKAMQPNFGERILSICGAGCVPFALSTYRADVTAVDADGDLLELAREDHQEIIAGNRQAIYSREITWIPIESENRSNFFKDLERLGRSPSSQIDFVKGDIRDVLSRERFDKAYLSNAVGYNGQGFDFTVELLTRLQTALPAGGLFYSANGHLTSTYLARAVSESRLEPAVFSEDESATRIAREYQGYLDFYNRNRGTQAHGWMPSVFSKR